MSRWLSDLSASVSDFERAVKPQLMKVLDADKIESIESHTSKEMKNILDENAGIDLWVVHKDGTIRGLASRVQWGHNFKTFTIRKSRETGAETEYEKRKRSIDNDALYPHYTCHSYFDTKEGDLLGFAVCKTVDLFDAIDNGYFRVNRTTNADFYIIKWDDVDTIDVQQLTLDALIEEAIRIH